MPGENLVSFHQEDVNIRLLHKPQIISWILTAIKKEGLTAGSVNIVFCSDKYLLNLNREYLDHDTFTDIITFDYRNGKTVSGDIFISTERVKENAGTYKVPFRDELHRVIIHGILHLCGYKDKNKKAKMEMTEREDFYLSLRKSI